MNVIVIPERLKDIDTGQIFEFRFLFEGDTEEECRAFHIALHKFLRSVSINPDKGEGA